MYSIPAPIYPSYTVLPAPESTANLFIGQSVKDLPPDSDTAMKKAIAEETVKTHETFKANLKEYDFAFETATKKAQAAKQIIAQVKYNKMISVTLLVTSILLLVGVTAAAVATGTLPLLFIAIPCVAGIIAFSTHIHIFNQTLRQLRRDIAAPGKLLKPTLNLPIYNPAKDLDLKNSRLAVQNSLASMSLKQLVSCGWSRDELLQYALLDRVTQLSDENRPAFYSHCIHLIETYGRIAQEHADCSQNAAITHTTLLQELRAWKINQEAHIRQQESHVILTPQLHVGYNPRLQRGRIRPSPTVHVVPRIDFASNWHIHQLRDQIAAQFAERSRQIALWHTSTLNIIESGFDQAVKTLDKRFTDLKSHHFAQKS